MAAEVQSNTNWVIEIGAEFDTIVPEQPVTLLIRQAFEFFYKIGVSPSMVTFDAKSGVYHRKGGSKFNKALCLALLAATWVHTSMLEALSPFPSLSTPPSSSKLLKADVVMNTVLGFIYLLFITFSYWTLFTKADAHVEILNQIAKVMGKVERGSEPGSLSKRKAQIISYGIIALCIVVAMFGTVGSLRHGNIHMSALDIINDAADAEARAVLMLAGHSNMTELNGYKFSANAPMPATFLVAAASAVWFWWAQFCWTSGFCMLTFVGVSMWLALVTYHQRIKQKSEKHVEEIRTFSRLLKIIEKLNGIYGRVILFSVVAGVLHFSVDMFTIFKVESDTLERILFLSDFVWFGCAQWATAQVYEENMKIGQTLRMRFEDGQFVSEGHCIKCGCRNEGTDMLLLLHQELNAQNVGLKGHGFFTCSYGFIGTVLGMISTYSVIVIQSHT